MKKKNNIQQRKNKIIKQRIPAHTKHPNRSTESEVYNHFFGACREIPSGRNIVTIELPTRHFNKMTVMNDLKLDVLIIHYEELHTLLRHYLLPHNNSRWIK